MKCEHLLKSAKMARLKSDKHAVEPSSEVESYYTTLEVARMLGMAVRSVQLMVDRGDLQAWKTPGGHRRITGSSLQRWLAKSRAGLTSSGGNEGGSPKTSCRQREQRTVTARVADRGFGPFSAVGAATVSAAIAGCRAAYRE
jgi:excisionase family DNA binding protein